VVKTKVLHRFKHGMGDSVQFTAVIKHLKGYMHDQEQHVAALRGKHTAFKGLADAVYDLDSGKPPTGDGLVLDHPWDECWGSYDNLPGTKTVQCIRNVFHLEPRWDWLSYQVNVGPEAEERVRVYLATLPKKRGFVLIHYEGNTSTANKNLSHEAIDGVCKWLLSEDFNPVVLDWDRRSPLPDNKSVFCPGADNPLWMNFGTGDAETIAALMHKASAIVAIDSGPQKIAFSTNTPTVAVWTGHHPYHYCDRADHAIHLVPHKHPELLRGNREQAEEFFLKMYRHQLYNPNLQLTNSIKMVLAKEMGIPINPMADSHILTATAYDRDYYEQHKQAGLDYLGHGDWQIKYGRWLIDALGLKNKTLLDVGCAAGSIAAGLAKAGAFVSGVDCNEHMIRMGREKWLEHTLKICDATNLHYWTDGTFDCIHSNNVFEHFKPELVPFILKELFRVTKRGGCMFAAFDTEELYAAQKRDMRYEDATHICIKPMAWWVEHATAAGWEPAPDLEEALRDHPNSYLDKYDWPLMVCRKP